MTIGYVGRKKLKNGHYIGLLRKFKCACGVVVTVRNISANNGRKLCRECARKHAIRDSAAYFSYWGDA